MFELFSIVTAINWQTGNWAMSCDFKGNDLSNKNSRGEDCSGICSKTAGCTHYTWTNYNGGTCWMKSGNVGKNNAISTTDKSMVCGIVFNIGGLLNPVGPVAPPQVIGNLITWEEFQNSFTATGYPMPNIKQYENFVKNAAPAGGINTKRELAMFLAQIMWESGGLRYNQEIDCMHSGCPGNYETSFDYAGVRYYGRGLSNI